VALFVIAVTREGEHESRRLRDAGLSALDAEAGRAETGISAGPWLKWHAA